MYSRLKEQAKSKYSHKIFILFLIMFILMDTDYSLVIDNTRSALLILFKS